MGKCTGTDAMGAIYVNYVQLSTMSAVPSGFWLLVIKKITVILLRRSLSRHRRKTKANVCNKDILTERIHHRWNIVHIIIISGGSGRSVFTRSVAVAVD